ncbi:cytochrome P450 [Streptomyces actinomycinicus]|uniref:Cytochrome P450 n=1 Tax=Streptomyces actinomycinicus TaxID=1695166 RepID=A0A937JM44_9ACTN|nr:cytochrome P450 [Streptomyces actinomycinicus]MBL1084324.1 cytochrome P450 [Streptomyces actinomycinicus]
MTTPDAVPLDDPRFRTEPATLYRELRRDHGTVVPVLLDSGIPAWLVVGYRELHRVTGDAALFSRDPGLWNQREKVRPGRPLLPVIGPAEPSVPSAADGRHRLRAAVFGSALDAVDPFALRRHAERFADELIDALCGTGEADLVAQYATLLPARVLARLYGFPDEDGPGLVTSLNDMIEGRGRALAGQAHLTVAVEQLLSERRKEPADDVVSRLLADDSGLGDEEIARDLMMMTAAGHRPTADWIGSSLRLMLTDGRFAGSLYGGRGSVAEAMNEVLWEDTPAQTVAGRWAARDTHLGGRRIRAGDLLLLGLQGANRDPRVRSGASARTGGNHAHFSFGHGEHRCPFPAPEIAEVIARTAIEAVLDRLPDIGLAVPAESLTHRPSPWLRGLTALPVRFTPLPAP